MKLCPFIFAMLVCVTARGAAAVARVAADGTWQAYSNALALAVAANNDIVIIPKGSNDWGAVEVLNSKRVMVSGLGMSNTIIRGTSGRRLRTTAFASGTNTYGYANLCVSGGTSASFGLLAIGSSTTYPPTLSNYNFRVHHILVDGITNRGIYILGKSQGVIDGCVLKAYNNLVAQGITHQGVVRDGTVTVPNLADDSYTNTLSFGTLTDYVCIEGNVWDWLGDGDGGLDGYGDYSLTVRFNLITNCNYMVNHEFGYNRSGGRWEFYGNKAYGTGPGIGFDAISHLRSSPGLACSNELFTTGYTMALPQPRLTYYRASGTNVFAAYPTGYYSAGSVTGTNKLDGNINTNTNQYGYPAFDQPGWGDPTIATATNLTQTFYGCYFKDNLYNGTNTPAIVQEFAVDGNQSLTGADGTPLPEPLDLLVLGRDYFDQTLMPGWTPAQYPHELNTSTTLSPASSGATPAQVINFSGVGGSGEWPYYFLDANNSGGSITVAGVYTAGTTNAVDSVGVVDTWGNIGYATVSVSGGGGGGTVLAPKIFRLLIQ